MANLRNLHMSDVICRKPLKIGKLEKLKTLTYISIYDWTDEMSGVEMMTRLKKLGFEEVDENLDVGKIFANLKKCWALDHLILKRCRFRSMSCLDEIIALRRLKAIKLDASNCRMHTLVDKW
ncbi:hypothetical protein SASPL_132359 [Salvia splendens]|uniref:Uncharacterized protein n=1 Tax=Salvia splendens TaxID=180675 RepID=A0A8X8X105_SALSN|nr:hypothetical protein SASPL_132359 [Salvia splendens]